MYSSNTCGHHQLLSDFLKLEASKILISLMFIFVQTTDGKAPALRVFTVCCASVGVSTESISLQGDCQRVLAGRFMALWLLGLGAQPRKDGSPSKGKWATAGPTADSSPICNFLCFIYLLHNDPASKPRGLVFPSIVWKRKKRKNKKLTRLSLFPLTICQSRAPQ